MMTEIMAIDTILNPCLALLFLWKITKKKKKLNIYLLN